MLFDKLPDSYQGPDFFTSNQLPQIPSSPPSSFLQHHSDSKNLCCFTSWDEQVVSVGHEHYARCSWCGTEVGEEWVGSPVNYKVYCSKDCQRAGELPNWSCALAIMLAGDVWSISTYGIIIFLFAFPISLGTIFFAYLVLKCYRIQQRIPRDSRRN